MTCSYLLSGGDVEVSVGAVESEIGMNGNTSSDVDTLVQERARLFLNTNLQKTNKNGINTRSGLVKRRYDVTCDVSGDRLHDGDVTDVIMTGAVQRKGVQLSKVFFCCKYKLLSSMRCTSDKKRWFICSLLLFCFI